MGRPERDEASRMAFAHRSAQAPAAAAHTDVAPLLPRWLRRHTARTRQIAMPRTFSITDDRANQTLAAALRRFDPSLSWTKARQLIASRRVRSNSALPAAHTPRAP